MIQQEFAHGYVGGETQDILYLKDNVTGTDDIHEFKVFIVSPSGSSGSGTVRLRTDQEVSVGYNSALN